MFLEHANGSSSLGGHLHRQNMQQLQTVCMDTTLAYFGDFSVSSKLEWVIKRIPGGAWKPAWGH